MTKKIVEQTPEPASLTLQQRIDLVPHLSKKVWVSVVIAAVIGQWAQRDREPFYKAPDIALPGSEPKTRFEQMSSYILPTVIVLAFAFSLTKQWVTNDLILSMFMADDGWRKLMICIASGLSELAALGFMMESAKHTGWSKFILQFFSFVFGGLGMVSNLSTASLHPLPYEVMSWPWIADWMWTVVPPSAVLICGYAYEKNYLLTKAALMQAKREYEATIAAAQQAFNERHAAWEERKKNHNLDPKVRTAFLPYQVLDALTKDATIWSVVEAIMADFKAVKVQDIERMVIDHEIARHDTAFEYHDKPESKPVEPQSVAAAPQDAGVTRPTSPATQTPGEQPTWEQAVIQTGLASYANQDKQ